MKEKIQSKIRAAHIWKYATIVCAALLVVSFLISTALDAAFKGDLELGSVCMGLSALATIICCMVYFGFRRNILNCVKILEKSGISLDEVASDLEGAKTIGKMRKFICGDKYFVIPSPFCVFSYKEILWVYLRRTTTTDTGTGASTTKKEVIFCTAHGKKFVTYVSWKVAKEFMAENKEKFLPELIVGYKRKYNKQYKEMVKKYK